MSHVLFPPLTRKPMAGLWLGRETPPRAGARPMAGLSGTVDAQRLAVFTRLQGHWILCQSGQLWITFAHDQVDHVLEPGQELFVPDPGKVIIGGRGAYAL